MQDIPTRLAPPAVVAAAILAFALDAAAAPPAGSEWNPSPALTDEFEAGKLSKWHDRNPQWKGRQPGYFSPANVSVGDGMLHLTARAEELPGLPEGYHTFTTAAVKSTTLVRYGYFEIRCRPMKSKASSAFWFYDSTRERWTEIDVFEICGGCEERLREYNMNVHVFHTPEEDRHWAKAGKWTAPYDLADEFHVYGLEWDQDAIRWYVDDEVVREVENTHWHQPLALNFDSETMPDWFGLPDEAELPSTFSIDYVRSWKRIDEGGTADGGK